MAEPRASFTDPEASQWWLAQETRTDIERIRASQEIEREQLEFQKDRFDEVLSLYKSAFKRGPGRTSVPDEFAQNVALFQQGGQFEQGARMEIERGGQQAIAAGQVGLASTGMSSGTNVAGLQARVLADTALSRAKIEEKRVEQLGGALSQAGAARLSAEQIRAQREANLMRTLSSF
jgi:hypothetical protein